MCVQGTHTTNGVPPLTSRERERAGSLLTNGIFTYGLGLAGVVFPPSAYRTMLAASSWAEEGI